MEKEVLKNKYGNGMFPVRGLKRTKLSDFDRVEGKKESVPKIIKKPPGVDYSNMTEEEIKASISEMWIKLGEPMEEEELQERAKAMRDFHDIIKENAAQNKPEWTLDEINAEIAAARAERRAGKVKGGL